MSEKKLKERSLKDFTLEELRIKYAELTSNIRQHGKKGLESEDPETERKRLYNNIKSIESRHRRVEIEKQADKTFVSKYGFGADDADQYGIRPKHERMYKQLFRSAPIGTSVGLKYLMMMTGLTLNQVFIMQKRTGLNPVPQVKAKEAKADQKYREDNGIYL